MTCYSHLSRAPPCHALYFVVLYINNNKIEVLIYEV